MARGRCAICHKRLTSAESIRRGIGPECWKKTGASEPIELTIYVLAALVRRPSRSFDPLMKVGISGKPSARLDDIWRKIRDDAPFLAIAATRDHGMSRDSTVGEVERYIHRESPLVAFRADAPTERGYGGQIGNTEWYRRDNESLGALVGLGVLDLVDHCALLAPCLALTGHLAELGRASYRAWSYCACSECVGIRRRYHEDIAEERNNEERRWAERRRRAGEDREMARQWMKRRHCSDEVEPPSVMEEKRRRVEFFAARESEYSADDPTCLWCDRKAWIRVIGSDVRRCGICTDEPTFGGGGI